MKPLNLLKMLPQNQPKASTVGFSIIELVVVVLMIGVLSAIAAPGWIAFINGQRTRTVNDGVFQALKSAQSDAKLKKEDISVQVQHSSTSPVADPPKIIIDSIIEEELNANGEIKAGIIALATGKCNDDCTNFDNTNTQITFNNQGVIDDENDLPFAVTTAIADGKGAKRCVIVQTILGSMRIAEGNDCPTPSDW